MQVTDEMVDRFLAWELPKDFHPDGGVKFERKVGTADGERDRADMGPGWWPVGTNLLTAEQAKQMLVHVLGCIEPLTLTQCRSLVRQHFEHGEMTGDDVTLIRAVENAYGIWA